MARHVLKFSGSSTADTEKLYATARRIAAEHRAGHEVIALLPGQETCTQALLAKARQIDPNCQGQDLEVLLAVAGSCAVCLCALALRRLGFPTIHPNIGQRELSPLDKCAIEQALKNGNILLLPALPSSELALTALLHADCCELFSEGSLSSHEAEFAKKHGVAIKSLPFFSRKSDLPVQQES